MFEYFAKLHAVSPSTSVQMIKSPLRICPLGAHVDHQDGLVTGMALEASVDFYYSPNENKFIKIQSLDFPDEEYFHLDKVPTMMPGYWGNYIRGSILALSQNYRLKRGLNGFISGKLPIGGLSSSAAVTTAYLMALCDVNEIEVSKSELIQLSHWVERNFIGLNNGILDQSANILSMNNHLMYMDCQSGKFQLVKSSSSMPEFEVVVVYSGLSKSLMSTEYNNRVDECKAAAWFLQEVSLGGVTSFKDAKLRDIAFDTYLEYKDFIPGRFQRRAEHFFSELERVKKGVIFWSEGNLEAFGRLMFESGQSSMYNYECGCPELITIFNLLKESPGVYGARFSGAGYRGCCIGLIDPKYKEEIAERINSEYPVRHPEYQDSYKIHFCGTDDGARILKSVEKDGGEFK